MAVSNGNCFICGKTAGKTAIKNHVWKEHNGGDEACYLIKAEGAYDRGYWLFFTIALNASLSDLDHFMRSIWCDCCGHLSAFTVGRDEIDMNTKITRIGVGVTLLYEYDFGSTTEILITFMDKMERPKQREKIQLLARNAPRHEPCDNCGAPATHIDALENVRVCDECISNVEDEGMLLPIVNSPRCGECAYCGELDSWTFEPDKPFPQPQKRTKR